MQSDKTKSNNSAASAENKTDTKHGGTFADAEAKAMNAGTSAADKAKAMNAAIAADDKAKAMNAAIAADDKGTIAENNFRSGYTCAQAVLLAFEKESGLTREALIKLGAPFGGGMGRMRRECGACVAAFMLSGLLDSTGDRESDYRAVREIAEKFAAENGSIICSELLTGSFIKTVLPQDADVLADTSPKPEPRTKEYYKKRPCPLLCRSAAEIFQNSTRHSQKKT